MNFNEKSTAVKNTLAEIMKDTSISDENLGKLTGVLNDLKELDKQHQEVVDKCLDYRDKYVKGITNFGTSDNPKEEGKGRSFEEITAEVIKRDGVK
jgi:ribosome assembly protein YihI (activator of Der GTPase)